MHASQENASSLISPQPSREGSSVTDTSAPISSAPTDSGSSQYQDSDKTAANTSVSQASEADMSRDR